MPYSVTGIDLVSTDSSNNLLTSDSVGAKFSADGTKIVFSSKSSGGSYDIYIKDLTTGTLTQVTFNGNGDSLNASFNSTGTKIIFESDASNLISTDTNGARDVFVYDIAGASTTRVSVDSAGNQLTGASRDASFFNNGNYIFTSNDSNLVSGDTNNTNDIFTKNASTGEVSRVSVNVLGQEANGEIAQLVSSNSRFGFLSTASNFLPSDTNGIQDLFYKSTTSGSVGRANTSSIGQQATDGTISSYAWSPDGTKITFASTTTNISGAPDLNGVSDIFVKNLITGQLDVVTTIMGVQANGASYKPVFSPDGNKVVFVTEANNLDPSDTNGLPDVYMKDLQTGEFTRISIDPLTGDNADGASFNAVFHPINNTKILFDSRAENLDGDDGNNVGDIFIATVTEGNTAPVAVADTLYEIENFQSANLYYTLTANDFDAEGAVTITNVITTNTDGTVFFDAGTQTLTYTPEGPEIDALREGQSGVDTFEYVIQDSNGVSRKAVVTVNITGMNDDPNAVDDSEDADLGITTVDLAPSLLGNDTDADSGDTKKIHSVDTTGTLGTVTFDSINQTLTYNASPAAFPTLGAGQTAEDTFTYTIIDSAGAISTATVTMTVTGINHAPVAVDDVFDINEGASTGNIYTAILANDTDTDTGDTKAITSVNISGLNYSGLSFSSGSQTLEYSATTSEFNELAQGEVVSEVFTYTMRDTAGETSTASVTVNITGVNDGPTADDDSVSIIIAGNATNDITSELLAGDTDPDNNAVLTIIDVTGSAQASVSAGVVNYNANSPAFAALAQGQTTTDSFTYTLSDEHGATDTATVNVTITGVNDGPVSVDDASAINEGETSVDLTSLVLSNDSDIDTGDTFEIIFIDTTGTVGVVDFSGGVLTYTATEGAYAGLLPGQTTTDTFTYTIQDRFGATSTSTVTMTITGVDFNDAPTAVNDDINATENVDTGNLVPDLLANDIDPDTGDTLRVISVNDAGLTLGTLAFDDINQTLVYSPNTAAANALALGETATDTFTYTIEDAAGETSTATATITVTGTNDGPVAVADGTTVTAGATSANLTALVLSNDTDVDNGAVLTIDSVDTTITNGTVNFDSNTQTLTYTANGYEALAAGETATDIFAYTVTDEHGATSTANVTVTITGANDGPTAVSDAVATTENLQTGNLVPDLLANDIDPDNGDTLSVISVNDAGLTIGSITFDENNQSLTYLADGAAADALAAGETHTESFTYTIADESGSTSTATATVTLNGVNDGPVSEDDASAINEGDTSVDLTSLLLSNDSDIDNGDTFSITDIDTTGTLGEVSFTGGVLTYTATAGAYAGLLPGETTTDTFTYTITDSQGAVSTSTVTMTITGTDFNDAPVANDDALNAVENIATANLIPSILSNDTDADNDTLRITSVDSSAITIGTLTFDETAQTLVYLSNNDTLAQGETTTETFTYTVEDPSGETSTATATITVTGVNDGPVAVADSTSVAAGDTTADLSSLVLSNDTDVDNGAILSVDSVDTTGTLGTVNLSSGVLTYTADNAAFTALGAGQTTTDSFAYTVTDEHGATSSATVTVTVTGANDGPVAVDDAVAATENVATGNLVAGLLSNDTDADTGDTLRVASVNGAGLALGALTFDETAQTLTYLADGPAADALAEGETTTETFTYTVEDTSGASSTATATVTLTGVNDGPVSQDDASAINEGDTSVDLTSLLLANDSDIDNGDTFSITDIDTTGTVGEVTFSGGVLTYTATEGAYAGLLPGQTTTDTFTYTITDSNGAVSTSTVTMTITGVDFNDAPVAVDDSLNAIENIATANLIPSILSNDTDADNDTLRVTSVDSSAITLGTLVFDEANQTLVYHANNAAAEALAEGETTTETFTYTVEDPSGVTSTATATITVTGTNDGPVAVADSTSVAAGATTANLTSLVLSNDTDVDNGAVLSVDSVDTTGTAGTVNLSSGVLTYTADAAAHATLGAGQTTTDSFAYTVTDEHGATSTATVTVTVTGANDGPVAVDDAINATENVTTGNLVATLLANDTDADTGDTLRVAGVNGATLTYGALAFNETAQTLTYAANSAAANALAEGEVVTETFTYSIEDTSGATSTATTTVTLTGVNDGPVSQDDASSINEGDTSVDLTSLLLSNDSDVDNGDTFSITDIDTTGTVGEVTFSGGVLTYTATEGAYAGLLPGETTTDTFTYTITDSNGVTSTSTVTMTITGVDFNDAPVAVDDAVSVNEDATTANLVASLLANDTDPDSGDTKTIVSVDVTGTTLGTVSFNSGTQTLTYAADQAAADSLAVGQSATDSFSYTMQDSAGVTSTATVTVTVNGVNDGPVSQDDASAINEGDTSVDLTSLLLANDSDIDNGDTFTITGIDTTGTVGEVNFTGGVLTYTATEGAYAGLLPGETTTDTFTYTITDSQGATSTSTVTMTITGVDFNDAPEANDDGLNATENVATGNLVPLILANDTDADNDILRVLSVDDTGIVLGDLTFDEANQTLVYLANSAAADALAQGETLIESFTYTIEDESGETATATATITLAGANDGPDAVNDGAAVTAGTTSSNLASLILSNDTDVDNGAILSIASVDTTGTQGTISFDAGTQTLTYAANTAAHADLGIGQTATDTFTYTVTDEHGATDTATVTVTITGANDGPTAVDDAVSVNEDATTANLTATLLANDTDPDSGDTKTIVSVDGSSTTLGTVNFNAGSQTLTYAANKNAADSLGVGQTATDTFTYTMQDAAGATSTATVTVTVTGVNDGPVAVNDNVSVNEDATTANLVPTLLSNDTDVDNGDTKRISSVNASGLVYGTVAFNATSQTLTYAANKALADTLGVGESATETFTYTTQDAAGATSVATVTMTINGVNDAPIAVDDAYSVTNSITINIADLLADDTDIDGDDLTFNGITVSTTKGTLVNNGDGTLTYTANNGYKGTDKFTYSVSDGNGGFDTAVVTLTVKSNGKYVKGTSGNDTLKGGAGNDTIEGFADKGYVTLSNKSYFLGTTPSQKLAGNHTDSNSSPVGWQKAWGQYTPLFDITAVGLGETEATGYTFSTDFPSFSNTNGNAHHDGIGVDGRAHLGAQYQQEIGYDPRSKQSEKLVFDSKGELMSKAAFDLSYFFSNKNGADALGSTKYSESGHWEAYRDGVLVGQGNFVAGKIDTNNSDKATLTAIGSKNSEYLLTLDFSAAGGFDKVILSANPYDGLNANQSAAAGKPLGTTKAQDSSDFMVRNVKVDMLEKTFEVKAGDHLWGGAGNDIFIFNKGAGVDVIHDFSNGDIVRTNYDLTDIVDGLGTDTVIFKNGSKYEAIVADDNGHTWDASDFNFI